jgi:hypothetical protein
LMKRTHYVCAAHYRLLPDAFEFRVSMARVAAVQGITCTPRFETEAEAVERLVLAAEVIEGLLLCDLSEVRSLVKQVRGDVGGTCADS